MGNSLRRARIALGLSTIVAAGFGVPAAAQTMNDAPLPVRYVLDENGVNLADGYHYGSETVIASIGSGDNALTIRARDGANFAGVTSYAGNISVNGSTYTATVPGSSLTRTYSFSKSGTVFTSLNGDGATMVQSGGSAYVLTTADGTVFTYGFTTVSFDQPSVKARLTGVQNVNGSSLSMAWQEVTYCTNFLDYCQGGTYRTKVRMQSVTSSYGYQMHTNFRANNANSSAGKNNWDQISNIVLINLAEDYCDPQAYSCALTQPLIAVDPGGSGGFTDAMGRQTTFSRTTTSNGTTVVTTRPSGAQETVVLDTLGRVSSVTSEGSTWQYSFSLAGTVMTAVVTNPGGSHRTVVSNTTVGLPTSVTNELAETTSFTYDASGRLASSTSSEGAKTVYTTDARGNVTQATYVPKPGSGLSQVSVSAGYPASCTNAKTCNQPTWTRDALQNETDYTYNAATGLPATVTLPAVNGVRPQTRYSYGSRQAVYKNSSGALVASGVPTTVLTGVSQCRTQASCTGTADETKVTPVYNNNLLPESVTVAAGDGSASRTTAFGYDPQGNVTSVDGPLPGSADTSNLTYNKAREVTLAVSADPDGAGTGNLRLAQQVNYAPSGLIESVEVGTADAAGTTFTAVRQSVPDYDTYGRQISVALQASDGTTYGVNQTSYDNRGRVQCNAVRMNSAAWGSLPADACTLQAEGSAGPDRITRLTYDAAGRVTNSTSGYGTADAVDNATATYTDNGQIATLTDANGNLTAYAYDGLDRLATVTYPGGSYEQYGYDANGNVTTRRTRAGETLVLDYDALNRLTRKTVPARAGLSSTHTRDVFYGYDLVGHPLYARFDSASGEGVTFGVDAFGEKTSETLTMDGVSRTMTSAFAPDGARASLQYPDGVLVAYHRDSLGRFDFSTVGASEDPLFQAVYDADGSVNALYRWRTSAGAWGNADAGTGFDYDPVGRLSSTSTALAGSSFDATTSLARNPAAQITARTRSNDAYAWTGAVSGNRAYAVNALNQYTSAGAVTFTYDANGNLTSDGSNSYSYDVENRLVARTGGATTASLRYDPLGRLYEVTEATAGSTTSATRFLYDGDALVAEYAFGAGAAPLRRYVHGTSAGDDPLVWFEGASVADNARRYLFADERGSIVAVTDGNGAVLSINSYDEYGIPAAANTGRFQYTGQAWLPELGMSYYKARMYSPTLGRFMQTDPIGYGDGMNWYAYVGNDPVNAVDPSGLGTCTIGDDPNGICVTAIRLEDPGWISNGSRRGNLAAGLDRRGGEQPKSDSEPVICKIAWTPDGDTKGENPKPGSGGYKTDLPGSTLADAGAVYIGLTRLAGDHAKQTFPYGALRPDILSRSYPSNIQLRIGLDGRYRIDIPKGVFDLKKPETIHFEGGKGDMCPTH